MNINQAFPSNYIKASDLQGRAATVTIRDVKMEQVGRDKDNKMVLYFDGKQKGLVLNKTNARHIANIAGSQDTDDWAGVQVDIYPTETEFAGETVDCIRVRAPKQPRARQQPGDDDVPAAAGVSAAPVPVTRAAVVDDDIPF